MILKQSRLNFNISYSELYQLGVHTGSLMQRDLSELSKYGISQSTVNELKAQVDNFAMVEPDESYEQDQMLATKARNELSEQVKTAIRDVMTSVDVAYSNNDIIYISSRNSNLSNISHNEVVMRGRVMVKLLQKNYEVLQSYGITEEVINNLQELSDQLSLSIDNQEITICEREVATNNRYKVANSLFETVSKYSRIGKRVWAERNEAKANDYVINPGPSAPPENSATPNKEEVDEPTGGNELPIG